MNLAELRLAFRWVWAMLSLVVLLVLLAPLVVPEPALVRWVPVCQAKLRDSECALCGMTTAFLAISRADFEHAQAANRASLALYALFVLNELGLTLVVFRARTRRFFCLYSA